MRCIVVLFILSICNSCQRQARNTDLYVLDKVLSCDVQLFEGLRVQPRIKTDGIYRVPFFSKEISGKMYLLPNYAYFDCGVSDLACLKKSVQQDFNIFEFARENGIGGRTEALLFTGKYVDHVIKEYEKLGVRSILSSPSSIGNCVIFYLDGDKFIAYVPNMYEVHNRIWLSRFESENLIKDKWYCNF